MKVGSDDATRYAEEVVALQNHTWT